MLRSMFRVVVVASVILSLTVFTVPSAQAGPSKATASAVQADQGVMQTVLNWLSNLVGVPKPKPAPKGPKLTTARGTTNGPCIDPLGRERPCL
jgi:hypothetical protein